MKTLQNCTILLCDINPSMVDAWKKFFTSSSAPNVSVIQGDILGLDVEVLAAAGNSYGFMTGGLDALYLQYFGPDLQVEIQKIIHEGWSGELPVSAVVAAGTSQRPFRSCFYTPTMVIPQKLPDDTINPYRATAGVLKTLTFSPFSTIAVPGMGAGTGQVPYDRVALQMFEAYRLVSGQVRFPRTLEDAFHRYLLLTR